MNDDEIIRKPRHFGHRIALACAAVCAVLMVPAFAAFIWFWVTRGVADTWTPSLAAVVAFLGCCAGVLHATSVPQRVLPPEEPAAVDPEKR